MILIIRKEAYVLLYREVTKRVVNSNSYTPVALDVMSYEYMRRANCEQRCLLLVSVLRAFGIPAAKDNVLYWADYSTLGHSWVSLVLRNNKTYSMVNGKICSMAKGHSIDASHFLSPQEEKQLRFLPLGLVKYEKDNMKSKRKSGLKDIGTFAYFFISFWLQRPTTLPVRCPIWRQTALSYSEGAGK